MSLATLFTDIADAIRAKTGSSSTIVANDFPTAIANIPSGDPALNLGTPFTGISYTTAQSLIQAGVTNLNLNIQFYNNDQTEEAFYNGGAIRHIDSIGMFSQTSIKKMFSSQSQLEDTPAMTTSNITDMSYCFSGCTSLTTALQYNTSRVTDMTWMFNSCTNLTEESLNNILAMCANSAVSNFKTLVNVGINTSDYPSVDFTQLSNYSAFVSAGWSLS